MEYYSKMTMRPVETDLGVAACLIKESKILLVKEAKGPQKYLWGLLTVEVCMIDYMR